MTTPTITQGHVDHVTRIAHSLAFTPAGELAGADELESEAMVVLWELALSWEPERQEVHDARSFSRYITMFGRRRLIDWLRTEYGRQGRGDRLSNSFRLAYLDAEADILPDETPAPDRVVVARDELAEVTGFIQQKCSERQKAAMVAAVDEDFPAIAEELSMKVDTLYTHASHARTRLRAEFAGP